MNVLCALRLLFDFFPIVILSLVSVQCTKKKTRRVERETPIPIARKNNRSKAKPEKKKEKIGDVETPKQSNEGLADTPVELSAATPATAQAAVTKSNRKKTKTEKVEATVDPTQKLEVNLANQTSTTVQVCPTQDDEATARPLAKEKPKMKEEFFEDQNDDDTLGCVKSIEN